MVKGVMTWANLRMLLLALALTGAAPAVLAHSNAVDDKGNAPASSGEFAFDKRGTAKKAGRTIVVDMHDSMRFIPGDIQVRQGESIRFIVRNQGKVMHEMVIGTMAELKSHGQAMRQHAGMEHHAGDMVHVAPGKKGEMIRQFPETGEFQFACLLPGHFEAGMVGKLTVMKG